VRKLRMKNLDGWPLAEGEHSTMIAIGLTPG
jgi:hypothetical protein